MTSLTCNNENQRHLKYKTIEHLEQAAVESFQKSIIFEKIQIRKYFNKEMNTNHFLFYRNIHFT